jgi:hypothetical protein
MKFIRDIVQGAGYLEGYGHHPGNGILFVMILGCGVAAIERGGLYGFLVGSLVGAVTIGPLWAIGCVGRAREYQQEQKHFLEQEKNT